MRKWFAVACVLGLAGVCSAQERIPAEQAQKVAKLLIAEAAKVEQPQLKTEVDADKATGLHHEKVGAMVIPDKALSADMLRKAGKEVVPVGQFWVRNLTLVKDGKPVDEDRLRLVTVKVDDKEHQLVLCLLGVRRTPADALELVVYGKDKEPLLKLPLQKADDTQDLPLDLAAEKAENDTAMVTINVLGKHKATLTVTKAER
jgi:hypothetical protein